MNKLLSIILILSLFLSQFQIGLLYAKEKKELEIQKQEVIISLNKTEVLVDKVVLKLDKKIKNDKGEKRLKEKQEEIKKYLAKTKEEITKKTNKKEIKTRLQKTKKVVLLKIISSVTKYENIEKNVPKELTKEKKEDAIETIQESIQGRNGGYSLIVKTKYKGVKLLKLLQKYDENVRVDFMYSVVNPPQPSPYRRGSSAELNYFEVFVSEGSLFRKEILEGIDAGDIPRKFLGIEIVQPEVFGIEESPNPLGDFSQPSPPNPLSQRERGDRTTYFYLEKLKQKTIEIGKKIKVGIIDTGIDYTHPDLRGNIGNGYDFINNDNYAEDEQGHGTHVSGILGARLNGKGIIGINPYVELIPLKICNKRGFCPSYAILRSLEYAKNNGIKILNMSLGGRGKVKENPICQGIKSLTEEGIIVVSASGNSNINADKFIPGGCDESITVGAVDKNLKRANFSNYGEKVDVSAPGVGIYSTYLTNKGNYKTLDGTSMSTPHITGLVSVIKTFKPELNTKEIKEILRKNSLTLETEGTKKIGGLVDVEKVVDFLNLSNLLLENGEPKRDPEESQKKEKESVENSDEDSSEHTDEYNKKEKKDSETSSGGQNPPEPLLKKGEYNPPEIYTDMMHKINALEKKDKANLEEIKTLMESLEKFINYEKETYEKLEISVNKKNRYLGFLNKKLVKLKSISETHSGTGSFVFKQGLESSKTEEFFILDNPSKFSFDDKEINVETTSFRRERDDNSSGNAIGLQNIEEDLPQLTDLRFDGEQIILNNEISELAQELENNPTKIANFVRNNIKYSPYYGSKKGALGCLREKICNDVDTSSLTISLLRASGIPARYKNTLVYLSKNQLKSMFGVEELKTVYASLFLNDIPVYIVGGQGNSDDLGGNNFGNFNFSGVSHLVVNRTFVEVFMEYDHNKGNFSSNRTLISFSGTGTTEELKEELKKDPKYKQKKWFSIDPSFKLVNHQKKEILNDEAGFDIPDFWEDFFSYNGDLSPLEKYKTEIQNLTGEDIRNSDYQSTKQIIRKNYDELPPRLAYYILKDYLRENNLIISGINTGLKTFSVLPDSLKHKLEINLLKKESREKVFSIKLPASELNNVPMSLAYAGVSDEDKILIKNYGGVHVTPSSLVDIRSYLKIYSSDHLGNNYLGYESFEGTGSIKIGDALILEFKHILNKYDKSEGLKVGEEEGEGEEMVLNTSQKFSVAGNDEGIYLSMSSIIQDNPRLNPEDPNLNSKILLEGNSEIARQYLKRLEINNSIFSKSLDIDYNTHMKRAVVTQNRVLSRDGDDNPTTFDFKGLSLDASSHISSHSNRGSYDDRNRDFSLLYGLQASYDEGEIFEDIAGLSGISTVSGLQYAYENNYLVYKIGLSNSGVVDSLSLSENTKENMKRDIGVGNIIITPSSFVVADNWRGLFYVSLDPNGGASYSIGEQVSSNGGWTRVVFDNEEIGVFKNEGDSDNFIFSEGILGSKKCRISRSIFSEIVLSSGYRSEYGLPCLRESYTKKMFYDDPNFVNNQVKTYEYKAIFLTKGANFISSDRPDEDYSFWVSEEELKGNPDTNVLIDTQLGTYISKGSHYLDDYIDVYNPKEDKAYRISGNILEKYYDYVYNYKLFDKKEPVYSLIGLPVSSSSYTEDSVFEITQDFENGMIYTKYSSISDSKFGVYGKWYAKYKKNPDSFGYPASDVFYNTSDVLRNRFYLSYYIQTFGNKMCSGDFSPSVDTLVCVDRSIISDIFLSANYQLDALAYIPGVFINLFNDGEYQDDLDLLRDNLGTIGDSEFSYSQWLGYLGMEVALGFTLSVSERIVVFAGKQMSFSATKKISKEISNYFSKLVDFKILKEPRFWVYFREEIKVLSRGLSNTKLFKNVKIISLMAVMRSASKLGMKIDGYNPVSSLGKSMLKEFSEKADKMESIIYSWSLRSVNGLGSWYPNAHHIIPQSFRGHKDYGRLINRLDNLWGGAGKFDLNDGVNGVWLPSKLHVGAHSIEGYQDIVFGRLDEIVSDSDVTQDIVINEIKKLREEILDGAFKINKNWENDQNQRFIDAVKKTKYLYE